MADQQTAPKASNKAAAALPADLNGLSIDDLDALLKAAAAKKDELVQAEREPALEQAKALVARYGFTARELGIATGTTKATTGTGSKTMSHPLKSTKDGSKTGVWLAHPPAFIEAEGCNTTYKAGTSVDAWLADPSDKAKKLSFLYALEKKYGGAPKPEQLGEVTVEEYSAYKKKKKAA
ncbi:hypothetical protein PMO31116_00493 [Pandoraea morbifera]|uniref:Uncharacterized protein n=1 Tax=Pandoraea morbifera TaxID=2508300 RepID=A0A5E4S0E4_9BURK|nr:H-NS histone family protein [Pandoraea morbifera]VVD68845.1 hypothetical protein PMO31116_00493 [Pandoraea morbifera]